MHYRSKQPKLVTLSGSFDYEQDFMSGDDWGIFNFARPSRLKKVAPAAAAIMGIAAIAFPPAAFVLLPAAAGMVTAGVIAAGVHETYRHDESPPPSQLEYTVIDPPTVKPPPPKPESKTPWGLIAAGAGAVYLMTR